MDRAEAEIQMKRIIRRHNRNYSEKKILLSESELVDQCAALAISSPLSFDESVFKIEHYINVFGVVPEIENLAHTLRHIRNYYE